MLDYFTYNNFIILLRLLADIGCVWVVIYYCIKIVKNNSRTIQIFKGILLIFIIHALAVFLGLRTVRYISELFVKWGFLAVIIIFQPEIRALLEKLGKTSVFSKITTLTVNEREKLVDELVKACGEMSKTKTGALISLEQGHSLADFIKTGTPMNSVVTSELLCSIFMVGTPLHDGAVIIQGVKIACAAAYFPPTTIDFPSSYGARHRAAVGISEITDSVTIIVSEETGNISIAEGGKLTVVSEKSLRDYLLMVICQTQSEVVSHKIKRESELENFDEEEVISEDESESTSPSFMAHFRNKNKKTQPNETVKKSRFKKVKKDPVMKQEEVAPEVEATKAEEVAEEVEAAATQDVKPEEEKLNILTETSFGDDGKLDAMFEDATSSDGNRDKPIIVESDDDTLEIVFAKLKNPADKAAHGNHESETNETEEDVTERDDEIIVEDISYKASSKNKKTSNKKTEGSES